MPDGNNNNEVPQSNEEMAERQLPFTWPQKEEFFRLRDTYLEEKSDWVRDLIEDRGVSPQYLDTLTPIFTRAFFIDELLEERCKTNTPENLAILNIDFQRLDDMPNVPAATDAEYTLHGKIIQPEDWAKIPSDQVKDVKIDKLQIIYNITEYERRANNIEGLAGMATRMSSPEEGKKARARLLERECNETEEVSVEEMAHAFNLRAAMNNPHRMQRVVNDFKSNPYNTDEVFQGPISVIEGLRGQYEGLDRERKARLWVRSFRRRYYPEYAATKEQAAKIQLPDLLKNMADAFKKGPAG